MDRACERNGKFGSTWQIQFMIWDNPARGYHPKDLFVQQISYYVNFYFYGREES